jgi:hypothetical protein
MCLELELEVTSNTACLSGETPVFQAETGNSDALFSAVCRVVHGPCMCHSAVMIMNVLSEDDTNVQHMICQTILSSSPLLQHKLQ